MTSQDAGKDEILVHERIQQAVRATLCLFGFGEKEISDPDIFSIVQAIEAGAKFLKLFNFQSSFFDLQRKGKDNLRWLEPYGIEGNGGVWRASSNRSFSARARRH